MSDRFRRASVVALALLLLPPSRAGAALVASRPGPIDRPLALAAADFDRDGCQDLAIANFEAGTISILLNQQDPVTRQCTGNFAPGAASPIAIGLATASSPTSGPIAIVAVDLNPEDVDSDGVPNVKDNCPNVANPVDPITNVQADSNNNGVGDACEVGIDTTVPPDGVIDVTIDSDGDGIPDYDPVTATLDNCPLTPNPGQEDAETAAGKDGLCKTSDDNTLLYGPDGVCGTPDDLIGDHVGDACEPSPDLVVLVSSISFGDPFGAVRIRLNDGAGGFVTRQAKSTGFAPSDLLLDDFTGDGRLDMVISNSRADAVQFFPGQADGNFGTGVV